MNHLDILYASLAAMAMGILVYLGLTTAAQKEPDTMDLDTVALAALATFVSTLVARNPEWLP